MKKIHILLLGCLLMASCTINRYYIVSPNGSSEMNTNGSGPVLMKTISYDRALPKVPELTVIKDASEYNKEDKHSFPIYGNETAVAPPIGLKAPRVAIWCTKECTVLAHMQQMAWDLHYFQEPSDSYIEDALTKEKYFIKGSYNKLPMDTSYNIKGASGEWICFFTVFPPLPKTCTLINLVNGNVTDVVKNGPGWWNNPGFRNTPVELLQQNQRFIKFRKTRIIE
ncbi:MAG: hypothetical protein ACI4BA_01865 [Prevotella sp.]